MDPIAYAVPGPLTSLSGGPAAAVAALASEVATLCRAVPGLVAEPDDPTGAGLAPDRLAERNARSAQDLLTRVLARDPGPLDRARAPEHRVVGTCRHHAVLATALLRAHGIPARARCGFASYFVPGRWVDHWITEHRSAAEARWQRIDPEILDLGVVPDPFDLAPSAFQTGGEAWLAVRAGLADPAAYGVAGTGNWGPGEIRGNVLRDLAALDRVEVLPWDEWDPMAASYAGTAGPAFDGDVDAIATACADDDGPELARWSARYAPPADLA